MELYNFRSLNQINFQQNNGFLFEPSIFACLPHRQNRIEMKPLKFDSNENAVERLQGVEYTVGWMCCNRGLCIQKPAFFCQYHT